jgi:hypothetical protein
MLLSTVLSVFDQHFAALVVNINDAATHLQVRDSCLHDYGWAGPDSGLFVA